MLKLMLFVLLICPIKPQKLIWEDNFDTPDLNKWWFNLGANLVNKELQCYTNRSENIRAEDGNLVIEARQENFTGCAFTSARLRSEGLFDYQYGTLEARIKIPKLARGLWPALWLEGRNPKTWPERGEVDVFEFGASWFRYGTFEPRIKIPSITKGLWPAWWLKSSTTPYWPDCGEIDVFEYGYPNYTNSYFTYGIHEVGPGAWGGVKTNKDQSTDFHFYRVDWNVTDLVFYLDDKKYGTFESRIKIPSITKGLWPAWWLLGTDSPQWPDCGEIDVFEYGYPDYTNSFFTYGIHEAGPGAWGQVETNKDQSTDFHVYRVDWNVTDIVFYLDDKQYGQFNITEHDTFHKPFYFLLDLAIGGTLPEIYDPKQITAKLPAQMLVDYIRVWQGERSTGMSHLVYML
ncbi:unnamed protein product [Bursaphelenchus okinawaensis]|uniref:GH16 domain-containing protein n=1 Tax=Bursaphelenchus okinawaensis TaxID=465554 RepID=A0A811LA28_9BILA|nr:unnamed protein product [Bursaphelenchus okinawaensis]CAG9121874.1 unnamed protein product [Bursaphelenchus okinawaensis]